MNSVYPMPKFITDRKGMYEFITNIYSKYKDTTNSKIIFDFMYTKYISPNLMSPLGLIFTKLKARKNDVLLRNTHKNPNIKSILVKYGFLFIDSVDVITPQNFIKYETFNGDDNDGFSSYLDTQLHEISNSEIIASLKTHIMEIFINVKMHARTLKNFSRFKNKEIFTSGFYDKEKHNVIFSIANNGQTFAENIRNTLNYNYDKEFDYLSWALKKNNSSIKDRSGGLGLSMLYDLVNSCEGCLYILSGKGYYEYSFDNNIFSTIKEDFSSSFPGTVITIKLPISSLNYVGKIEKDFLFTLNDLF